jgi:hypothetical protein
MSATGEALRRRIADFRNRAEEVRVAAEDMRDPGARIAMFRLAETYEKVARHLEAAHVVNDPISRAG